MIKSLLISLIVTAALPVGAENLKVIFEQCTDSSFKTDYESNYHFFIWLSDNNIDAYAFSTQPKMSIDGDELVVENVSGSYRYSQTDIKKITMSDDEMPYPGYSNIEKISSDHLKYDNLGESLNMKGMKAHEYVNVFDVNGRCLKRLNASDQGDLLIPLFELPKGIYIFQTETRSFKVIRK